MKYQLLFKEFFNSEKAGGILLLFATVISIFLANSFEGNAYVEFWRIYIGPLSIEHWINDGLMAVFFFLIGLELKREIYQGELSSLKSASLPMFGALGGMLVPASIFLFFNFGTPTQSGAGIPMATDIAFAIGILSLLGNKVPTSLKIFLTALAVIDDLGAIIVIALFYTTSVSITNLLIALAIFGLLVLLNRLKVNNLIPYLLGGLAMWYFMLNSGIHATITGVILAFTIPYGDGGKKTPSYFLQHLLHKPVAFFILPLFALANTAMPISANWDEGLLSPNSLGVILGLFLGKPIGILIFASIGVSLKLSSLPVDLKWKNIIGVGMLAGIGFTMSIFITQLAFTDQQIINDSKIAILIASLFSGIAGLLFLKSTLKDKIDPEIE
jgi:NhaA family Na+:H+ antiporter